ncbi:P-loop containing nucleoside triphosphate hydrolase protein [Coprinopsis sp. MPI-PUGE-AT-0042]|nr:P-loop containing nucleoside triphosphate hydrolase protein [Coprinopsis sp. MPI-PUGE-AT-0042]
MPKPTDGSSTAWKRKMRIGQDDQAALDSLDGLENDIIILVMGPTGVGKSTFIKEYTGNQAVKVGHHLQSCTRDVTCFLAPVPMHFPGRLQGRRLILVDTPGFDDTFADDSEILTRVTAWLAQSYNKNMQIAGVIYMNDISQKRMFGSTRMNLKMFTKLCGDESFKKVVLATSQWDLLPDVATGARREAELKADFWKNVHGAKVMRVQEKPKHHQDIINHLLSTHLALLDQKLSSEILQIQTEVVDMEKFIPETDAGRELKYTLAELLKLQTAAKENALDEDGKEEMAKKVLQLKQQMQAMKVSLGDRIRRFLGFV